MRDKELKKLSRGELMDIIYEQQKRLEESEKKVRELQAELEDRVIRLKDAGSIAEAALKINGVFLAAQAAADQYLLSVKTAVGAADETAPAQDGGKTEA